MEVKVQKNDFVKALSLTAGVVNPKTTLPALGNILFQANESNSVTVAGTDLEVSLKTWCPAEVVVKGEIALPARKVYDIVRELPEEDVFVTVTKNNAVNIKAKKSFFKISGLDSNEFPKLPKTDGEYQFEVDAKALKQCLALTSIAVSHDEARYTLNGILLVIRNGKARFVSTDGKRLAYVEREWGIPKNIAFEIIIPLKAVLEITKSLGDDGKVNISYSKNQVAFEFDNAVITTRLIEGKFPNFEQVIPKEEKIISTLDKTELLSAIKRVSLLTSQESQSVKLDFVKGRVSISSRTPNIGEAKEDLDAENTGDDLTIGFNPGYMIDALKEIRDEKIKICMTQADKPALIKADDGFLYVVMPMQLN